LGECFDLERGCRPAADLSEEEPEILLNPAQEGAQLSVVAHIGGIARREGGTVVGKVEDALSLA
jgi:hypothetical protein